MNTTDKLISRPTCVLTGSKDLEHLHTFKKFPAFIGCTESIDANADIFSDMSWSYSKSSGIVQLDHLLDPSILYSQTHGPGTTGNIWKQHHKKFYDMIKKYPVKNVLEVGGANGNLVNHFLAKDEEFNWTIIEPSNVQTITDRRVKFYRGFFEAYQEDTRFDAIVHSHVFEHVYTPRDFLQKVSSLLIDGGMQFISIPNMKYWLEQGFTNTLSFEHSFYVDYSVLEYFLTANGFEIIDLIIEDHSIFVACKKTNIKTDAIAHFPYVKNIFMNFIDKLKADVQQIIDQVKQQKVFLFGGHVFSQTLINLGLPESQVYCILDNDKNKHGKRLYGTNLNVKSPHYIQGLDSPVVILRAGAYSKEIKESLLEINHTTRII